MRIFQKLESRLLPFGLKHKGYNAQITGRDHQYGYGFNGEKEEQNELGLSWIDYGARNYDASLSRWMSIDPLTEKYYNWSPYNFVVNSPLQAVDSDGRDVVFLLDREAASGYGHGAVLIGNEKDGWKYYSINGTGEGASPWGKSKNADSGTAIVDANGEMISDLESAILAANSINPDESHSYDEYKRLGSNKEEDKNAKERTEKVTKRKTYGIIGPGYSCIDPCQRAFKSVVDDRELDSQWWKIFKDDIPGEEDLIPNNWFDKLDKRVESANRNKSKKSKKTSS